MQYFGDFWDVPATEGATPIPTPVDEECLYCDEKITEGDQGFSQPFMQLNDDKKSVTPIIRFVHRECQLRAVVGSIGHLKEKCSCYGGTEHDDLGMTRREAALAVWKWVEEHGV